MRASGGPSICPTCRGLWGRSGCSPARSSPGAAAAGSEEGRVGEKGGFRGGPDHLKKKKERNRQLQLRQNRVLLSTAIGPSVQRCIRELAKLYDRSLRSYAHIVSISTPDLATDLFAFC